MGVVSFMRLLCDIGAVSSGALIDILYQVRLIISSLVLLEQICMPADRDQWWKRSLQGRMIKYHTANSLEAASQDVQTQTPVSFLSCLWKEALPRRPDCVSLLRSFQECPWQSKHLQTTEWQSLRIRKGYCLHHLPARKTIRMYRCPFVSARCPKSLGRISPTPNKLGITWWAKWSTRAPLPKWWKAYTSPLGRR